MNNRLRKKPLHEYVAEIVSTVIIFIAMLAGSVSHAAALL